MPTTKPKTVDEYINAAPVEAQEKLLELRSILKKVAPKATEAIKWGSPVLEEKRILFAYTAFKSLAASVVIMLTLALIFLKCCFQVDVASFDPLAW